MDQAADIATEVALMALQAGASPLDAVVKLLASVTVNAVHGVLSSSARKDFLAEIQTLFIRLTEQGYITPLFPQQQQPQQQQGSHGQLSQQEKAQQTASPATAAPIGWIMTAKGADELFFAVYTDIARARGHFHLTSAGMRSSMDLFPRLVINLNSKSRGEAIRARLGSTWPAGWGNAMFGPPGGDADPVRNLPSIDKRGVSRFARGMVRNAARSPGHKDLLLARVLGLAQVCGIGEIGLLDLMELMVHSSHYEKIARRVVAAALGVHYTVFTGFALQGEGSSDSSGGMLGGFQNPKSGYAERAAEFEREFVQIGAVERGRARIFRGQEMVHVEFKIDRAARPVEGEAIYMVAGWATALLYRAKDHPSKRSLAKDMTIGLVKDIGKELLPPPLRVKAGNMTRRTARTDMHGNPMYFSSDLELIRVSIKRTPAGKLAAKIAGIGDYRPPDFSGQGVFGVRCRCTAPDPTKILPGAAFKGYKRENIFKWRADQPTVYVGYDAILYHWSTGDLPMILMSAEILLKGTYIQVSGECMYCATSRALGCGCNYIVAGGW
ncbi:hypothetical protein BJX64DRAFT_295452 [Aspergillus heterothallicus]